jgi:hypothetical protein
VDEQSWAEVQNLIEARVPRDGRAASPASENDVREAEAEVGRLPDDYRRFLTEFGWLETGTFTLFGVGRDTPTHLDLVAETRAERFEFEPGLPDGYAVIAPDGAGNFYCVAVDAPNGTSAVYFRDHEFKRGRMEEYSDSVTAWLTERLEWWDE